LDDKASMRDPFPRRATALQPLHDVLGHLRAALGVTVKSDALCFLPHANRLGDVVQ
jgi:hypothetical protein